MALLQVTWHFHRRSNATSRRHICRIRALEPEIRPACFKGALRKFSRALSASCPRQRKPRLQNGSTAAQIPGKPWNSRARTRSWDSPARNRLAISLLLGVKIVFVPSIAMKTCSQCLWPASFSGLGSVVKNLCLSTGHAPWKDQFIQQVDLTRDLEDESASIQEDMLKANHDLLLA